MKTTTMSDGRHQCPDCGQTVAASARVYEVPRFAFRPLRYRYLLDHRRPDGRRCPGAFAWLAVGFREDWKPPRYLRRL